jgi:hypothetical protein
MTPATPIARVPMAYELKRRLARRSPGLWNAPDVSAVLTAPVYVFPDQERLDSDEVARLAQAILPGRLQLPHPAVMFEIVRSGVVGGCMVALAVAASDDVKGYLFQRDAERGAWTEVLASARFLPDGVAEVETNPKVLRRQDIDVYSEVLPCAVWRALGLLAAGCTFESQTLSPLRREKLARIGVRGWEYRVADIDPGRIAESAARLGSTHGSPRWHIRRGHWRSLGDGRRVFVRECEVGDRSRGGIVKDYRLEMETAG